MRALPAPTISSVYAPYSPNRHLTREERAWIIRWHEEGLTTTEIAALLHRPPRTIRHVIQSGKLTPTKSKGRPYLVDDTTAGRLILHATLNAANRQKLWRNIASELGLPALLDKALNSAFKRLRYKRRKATKKPLIDKTKRENRLT